MFRYCVSPHVCHGRSVQGRWRDRVEAHQWLAQDEQPKYWALACNFVANYSAYPLEAQRSVYLASVNLVPAIFSMYALIKDNTV